MVNKYILPLFGKVMIEDVVAGKRVDPQYVDIFNAETAAFGYTFSGKSLNLLKRLSETSFMTFRSNIHKVLDNNTNIENVRVLFNKFPHKTPDQNSYLVARIVGMYENYFGLDKVKGQMLSCGHVIDRNRFDLSDFGACPICQFEVDELATYEQVRNSFKSVSPLKLLDIISSAEVDALAENILARNSSISTQEKEFLAHIMATTPTLKLPEKCFKETLPFIYVMYADNEYVKSQLSGATDVLRIAYYVSNAEADLSLKENVRFKFNAKQTRDFLSFLNEVPNLEEDLLRHRERWLRFGEITHPQSKSNQAKYPKVAEAFQKLRNDTKAIPSFNRSIELSLKKLAPNWTSNLLVKRPGEFARRLDKLVRHSNSETFPKIVENFESVIDKVQTKLLFELRSHFKYRSTATGSDRLFFIKGANKFFLKEDDVAFAKPIPDWKASAIVCSIELELIKRFGNKEPEHQTFYIDPRLMGRLVPFNRRGDSKKSENVITKGSRYPFNGDVIRLFVWWKGSVDVDLSANFYDENWNTVGHVAFTNLKNGYATHSGDIQNAPNGATEFIDFDIAGSAGKIHRTARYVVTSIISFRGQTFDTFPCYGGFMERDSIASGKLFEPMSVATKVEISTKSTTNMMFAFDLATKEVILMDMMFNRDRYSAVQNLDKKFKAITKNVISLPERKPTFHDVLSMYVIANGKWVTDKEQATTIFDLDMDEQKIFDILA